jgi:hypothetical protein
MIAPNGDQPASHRASHHTRAISIDLSLYPRRFSIPRDVMPGLGNSPEISLIYLLLGATVLLLIAAFVWSLVN